MPGKTRIEWSDATWNPATGCTKVSPGCAHCYAETFAERWRGIPGHAYEQGFDLRLWPDRLAIPARWRKPRRIFVNSMSDLFHEEVPEAFIERVFVAMLDAPQHIFQVLTKRPERMADVMPRVWESLRRAGRLEQPAAPHVWLGVTIENRRFVDRADLLRDTPAAVRFVSAEPLLGPLVPPNSPVVPSPRSRYPRPGQSLNLRGIDWLIAGGESGAKHRPIRPEWVRDLRDACHASGTAFFFKQWGGRFPKANGRILDGVTHDDMPQEAARA